MLHEIQVCYAELNYGRLSEAPLNFPRIKHCSFLFSSDVSLNWQNARLSEGFSLLIEFASSMASGKAVADMISPTITTIRYESCGRNVGLANCRPLLQNQYGPAAYRFSLPLVEMAVRFRVS
ncbi:hypothetical protein AVEN_234585-1 [Araneus ventricosus]|uniref:Uncharacterized protein n=1 Tax=Araneus ventricosus TaxID=182803 RepID=A0A4Y2RS69_ARAVE|nr:hypothetical protein AVEN_234585-1 [Araneus ventricosus]